MCIVQCKRSMYVVVQCKKSIVQCTACLNYIQCRVQYDWYKKYENDKEVFIDYIWWKALSDQSSRNIKHSEIIGY